GRARAERDGPNKPLHEKDAENDSCSYAALEQAANGVVANAERLGKDQTAQTDRETAYCGPPHPVDLQLLKGVFRRIDGKREQRGKSASQDSNESATCQGFRPDEERMLRNGEEWAKAKDVTAQNGRDGAGERDGDQAAGLPFKEQELDGQKHGRDGRSECRGHSSGCSRDEQGFAFGAGEVKQLGDHGAERAARHDDRAFRAEWSAGTNRNCRGKRLENCDLRLDFAAIDENCFDCFGNAVAANAF